jgi:2-methylcitrate dehydratase PrpD
MMREISTPTMLHDGSGMGALVGTMAVLMAEDGFKGAPAITVEAEEASAHWADLGQLWTVELNYIKPYPICRWAHAAIDALGGLLKAHQLGEGDIERIDVRTFAESAELFAGLPETTSQAQYSLGFALATRLVHGHIGPEHISGDGLKDKAVAAALKKINVCEEPRHSQRFPIGRWSDVTLTLKDGRSFHSGDVHARGGPEAPMELAEVEAKFFNFCAALPQARSKAIWKARARLLEPEIKFTEILSLLFDAPSVR